MFGQYYASYDRYVAAVGATPDAPTPPPSADGGRLAKWREGVVAAKAGLRTSAPVPPVSVASVSTQSSFDRASAAASVLSFSRRAELARVYEKAVEVEAYGDGYCYLYAVRSGSMRRVAATLGPYPCIRGLLGVDAEDAESLGFLAAVGAKVNPDKRSAHLGVVGETSLLTLLRSADLEGWGSSSLGAEVSRLSGCTAVFVRDPGFRVGGDTAGKSGGVDFTACRCKVHAPPLAGGHGDGCGVRPVGRHPVLKAAAERRHVFCHAEESVRRADWRFERLVSQVPPVPAYRSVEKLPGVGLLASGSPAAVEDFGRGFCYLAPVRADIRWRVARVLGPNPRVEDVLPVWSWTLRKDFKEMEVVEVGSGLVHVRQKPGAKGIFGQAGEELYRQLERYSRGGWRVGATVGGFLSVEPLWVSEGFSKTVRSLVLKATGFSSTYVPGVRTWVAVDGTRATTDEGFVVEVALGLVCGYVFVRGAVVVGRELYSGGRKVSSVLEAWVRSRSGGNGRFGSPDLESRAVSRGASETDPLLSRLFLPVNVYPSSRVGDLDACYQCGRPVWKGDESNVVGRCRVFMGDERLRVSREKGCGRRRV